MSQRVTSASQILTKPRAGLAEPTLLAIAGSDGVRCVARAGQISAHEALPRYALSMPLLYIPTPGQITSHFGLLFRLYYRYDAHNSSTTTICTYRVHSKQLFPINHSSTCIFSHFGCSFLHVFQGAFLRSNPWCSSWAHE